LGPGTNGKNVDRSIVKQLYRAGQISELKVGLNYENPWDLDSFVSAIHFGYFDYS
jgi:hypothetical protein